MHPPQKPEQIESECETVFTVTDYYDGPRKGIANFRGKPHFYECIFDSGKDDYSVVYRLTPLDEHVFHLAMESWDIWRRWERAFHTGKTNMETHPALPQDKSRYEELKTILDEALKSGPNAIMRMGNFFALPDTESPPGVIRLLQVLWLEPCT